MNTLKVDFRSLIPLAGSEEGARVLFERLIVALMRLKYRDAANLRAKQGDWGIDCFSGSLAGGTIIAWQAKYFINGVGQSQQKNIRGSLNAIVQASQEKKFKLTSWTLCIPCQLSPDERRWWEQWKKRSEKKTGIKINLLDEDGLRSLLFTRDAEHILHGTFGSNPTCKLREALIL